MHTTTAVQLNLWGNPLAGEATLVMVEDAQERAARGGCGEDVRAEAQGRRGLHAHSLEARDHNQDAHKGRKQLIVECLRLRAKPLTDRQIRDACCGEAADMNSVRPRITELIREGTLMECGEIVDPATGENVRVVWLA
jgi:hypothetical protein